jgi:hypothetical protein
MAFERPEDVSTSSMNPTDPEPEPSNPEPSKPEPSKPALDQIIETMAAEYQSRPRGSFLALPFDLRYMVYEEIFPASRLIYLGMGKDGRLHGVTPLGGIPLGFMSACHQLRRETNEYLFNRYLFNVVGDKRDCLENHPYFCELIRRWARGVVHIDAFSEGVRFHNVCVALHAGEGHVARVRKIDGGVHRSMQRIRWEVQQNKFFEPRVPPSKVDYVCLQIIFMSPVIFFLGHVTLWLLGYIEG